MSLMIKLKFLTGRYHATPWGRHVNEGVAEWPPSPWRFLRALVAVWKRTCPELSESQVRVVLEKLLPPPRFYLPPHRVAHTRHYMPWEKKGPADRTLVLDTFTSVSRESPIYMVWTSVTLNKEQQTTLAHLLLHLTSLGRAEAWVEAEIDDVIDEEHYEVFACEPDSECSNPVPVFCADPATALSSEHYPQHDAKKLSQGKINGEDFLFDCPRWHLCLDTETLHKKRWPTIPGARWLNYARPVEQPLIRASRSVRDHEKPTVATFILDGPVLPLVKHTLLVADAFRLAAMGICGQICKRSPEQYSAFRRSDDASSFASSTLSGRTNSGQQRTGNQHAHFLPISNDNKSNQLQELIVWAPEGFDKLVLEAFSRLQEIPYRMANSEKLQVRLIGLGKREDFPNQSQLTSGRVWHSVTPFISHRHLKTRGTKRDRIDFSQSEWKNEFLKLAATELIARQGIPGLKEVSILTNDFHKLHPAELHRYRLGKKDDGMNRYCGYLQLTFTQPLAGPLCLGYASHFGMGLFEPIVK